MTAVYALVLHDTIKLTIHLSHLTIQNTPLNQTQEYACVIEPPIHHICDN